MEDENAPPHAPPQVQPQVQPRGMDKYPLIKDTWAGTLNELLKVPASPIDFHRRLGVVELYDYRTVENEMRELTRLVIQVLGGYGGVSVIPRGSFVSRSALLGSVDLDVDLIFDDSFRFNKPNGQASTIKEVLGVNPAGEITFDTDALTYVLDAIWGGLSGVQGSFIKKRGDDAFTRSITAETINNVRGIGLPPADGDSVNPTDKKLDIDLFVKIKTNLRGIEGARGYSNMIIVGIDKNTPSGGRRYQTTSFIPADGVWVGDRRLNPVDRSALLMLKWFKSQGPDVARMKGLRSHHLLSAINALHELSPNSWFYEPERTNEPPSNQRIIEVMYKALHFCNEAYKADTAWLLERPALTEHGYELDADYPFPQVSWTLQETMQHQFLEAYKWNMDAYTDFIQNNFIEVVLRQLEPRIRRPRGQRGGGGMGGGGPPPGPPPGRGPGLDDDRSGDDDGHGGNDEDRRGTIPQPEDEKFEPSNMGGNNVGGGGADSRVSKRKRVDSNTGVSGRTQSNQGQTGLFHTLARPSAPLPRRYVRYGSMPVPLSVPPCSPLALFMRGAQYALRRFRR
eukprot:TRINITY_DN5206_c0_g1_i4.p1 TRINITY_DN5206_c0_g1~~TRINITY_DN5206_c0_g1_i4.p1  ORF type:complete len:567 (+),score=99.46 TRINITY_DN5206_c0_g1_i4:416-2116(+)